LAGHNVSFDYNVLYWWSKRLLGEDSEELMGKINKFIFLDTLALSRWIIQYHKRIAIKANLGTIAEYLGVKTSNHTASADVFACKEIAKILLGMGEADGN
jgi:DNA polymerase III epsilon subunit-like protein